MKNLYPSFLLAILGVLFLPFVALASAAEIAPEDLPLFHYLAFAGVALEVVSRLVPTSKDWSFFNRLHRALNYLVPNRTKTPDGAPAHIIIKAFKKRK